MKRFDLWKLSLLNVFSSPVRSLLTVLGFAIGVAAILAVITLGDAGQKQVQSEMNRLGIDRVWLTADAERLFDQGTGEWLAETTGMEADELVYLPAAVRSQQGASAQTTVIGCSRSYLSDAKLKEGRMFCTVEWDHPAQTALIGEVLADELGVSAGELVIIAQNAYEVCGVLHAGDGVSTVPLEEAVILPLDAVCGMTRGTIHEIQLNVPENRSLHNAQKTAVSLLAGQGYEAESVTMEVQMEAAASIMETFVNVLRWVAMICVLVGGVGVMNILLVSVRERRREIGVMKSMGTTPMQICTLFLLEALAYAATGGILGILLGMGLIDAAGRSIELSANARAGDCLTVFLSAVSIGLFFGVIPALNASRLTCVDALRQE